MFLALPSAVVISITFTLFFANVPSDMAIRGEMRFYQVDLHTIVLCAKVRYDFLTLLWQSLD